MNTLLNVTIPDLIIIVSLLVYSYPELLKAWLGIVVRAGISPTTKARLAGIAGIILGILI